ncbi:unnamed protein product (mitochondrion) [Plasmodiophora brassicae]|uniref:Uncharacterized protein n=1 Tax=Plasmodiophora brassicae TaxID=37360 RepID=A0A3P3YFG6_PLABS|nr:unnamed protein product [Plasmodiophora brassicae]
MDDDDLNVESLRAKVAGIRAQRKKRASAGQCGPALDGNEFLKRFEEWRRSTPGIEMMFKPSLSDYEREQLFASMPLDDLMDKYAWAIPDDRAIRIIREFAPIVEVGAGKGYWARLLRDNGVDAIAYDKTVGRPGNWTRIEKGGPEDLSKHADRALFLCYPDDFEDDAQYSLAEHCLRTYRGDTVILVGEMLGSTMLENPWGKSIGPEAQLELHARFHMVLRVPLPSFPVSRDTLSVWKRTRRFAIDDDFQFADIDSQETIDQTLSCPATAHLI